MTSPRCSSLFDDILDEDSRASQALAASLLATRQAAARRRRQRQTTRAAAAILGLLVFGWIGITMGRRDLPAPMAVVTPGSRSPDPVAPPAAFVSIATRVDWAPQPISTTAAPVNVVTTSAASLTVVSTQTAPVPVTLATEDDLFNAAGPRPAALRRRPNGSPQWVWLDQPTPHL